jgi:hypothetical protein
LPTLFRPRRLRVIRSPPPRGSPGSFALGRSQHTSAAMPKKVCIVGECMLLSSTFPAYSYP